MKGDEDFSNEIASTLKKPADASTTPVAAGPVQPGLITRSLQEVVIKPVKWIVQDYLPRGMLVLIGGHGGAGKSTLLAHVAACVTQGRCALGLHYANPIQADVLIYNCEDAKAEVLKPRLLAAGADLDRVRLIDGITKPDGSTGTFSLLNVQQLFDHHRLQPFGLLIIDPVSSTVGKAGAEDNSETDVRPLLEGLANFAEETGATVVAVKHLGKAEKESAAMRIQGSVAYIGVSRMVLALTIDPEDKSRRILAHSKTNLPIGQKRGVSFATEPPPNPIDLVFGDNPHLTPDDANALASQLFKCSDFRPWEGDIEELVNARNYPKPNKGRSKDAKEQAAAFLMEYLTDGPKPSLDCHEHGNKFTGFDFSISWWKKRLDDANGTTTKIANAWHWSMPDASMEGTRADEDEAELPEAAIPEDEPESGPDSHEPPSQASLDALKG